MAKTKRPSKKKEEPKADTLYEIFTGESPKESSPEAQQESGEKHLAASDLLTLECTQRDIENFRLKMAVEEQSLQTMVLTQEILKSKIEKQKLLLQEKSREYENAKSKYGKIKAEIFEKYSLPGDNFGYDTVTGKIVQS